MGQNYRQRPGQRRQINLKIGNLIPAQYAGGLAGDPGRSRYAYGRGRWRAPNANQTAPQTHVPRAAPESGRRGAHREVNELVVAEVLGVSNCSRGGELIHPSPRPSGYATPASPPGSG